MKRGVIFILTFWAVQSYSQDSIVKIDISEAIRILKNNNYSIKASDENRKGKEYERKAAKGLYLPSLETNANYFYNNNDYVIDLGSAGEAMIGQSKITGGLIDVLNSVYSSNPALSPSLSYLKTQNTALQSALKETNWTSTMRYQKYGYLELNMKYAFYTGGKISAANKAAKANLEIANTQYTETTNAQISDLIQKYYGLRLAEQVISVRKDVMEGMQKHLDDAMKLEKNGQISNAERLHAEMAYSDAVKEYKKAINDMELIRTVLKDVLSDNRNLEPTSLLFINKQINNLEYYQNQSQKNNTMLSQIKSKYQLAQQGTVLEKSNFLPTFYLLGNYKYKNNMTDMTPTAYLGVGMKLSLFEGFSNYNKFKAAKSKETEVLLLQKKAEDNIHTYIQKVYQQLENAIEEFEANQKTIEFAKEYLRAKEKAFSEGFDRSTEVVDARLFLSKAKIEQLKTMYSYDIALSTLLEISGNTEDFVTYYTNTDKFISETTILK